MGLRGPKAWCKCGDCWQCRKNRKARERQDWKRYPFRKPERKPPGIATTPMGCEFRDARFSELEVLIAAGGK